MVKMRNNRGTLTLDFIFGLVLVGAFSGILMALTLTMVITEVAQYISFAAARNYFAAHVDQTRQQEMAKAKFEQLMDTRGIRQYFRNGWFNLKLEAEAGGVGVGNFQEIYETQDQSGRDVFVGVRLQFNAPVLDFEIPFYGSTSGDDNNKGFRTHINSFLGREPTMAECRLFVEQRFSNIQRVTGFQGFGGDYNKVYAPIMDNGC